MLYKVYPSTIRVEYKDGAVAEHHLVRQNVRSGFLVSSLPRELRGVRNLLETGEGDKVRAVPFRDNYGAFEREFQVTWLRASLSSASPSRELIHPFASIESKQMTR
jgi:hypothetical protein